MHFSMVASVCLGGLDGGNNAFLSSCDLCEHLFHFPLTQSSVCLGVKNAGFPLLTMKLHPIRFVWGWGNGHIFSSDCCESSIFPRRFGGPEAPSRLVSLEVLLMAMACVAAGLQNDALSSGTEVPRSARNMAAALRRGRVWSIGVLLGCFGGKVDGPGLPGALITWWFNHLPGKSIYLP